MALNVCGSPRRTETDAGETLTVMPEGGSCDGPEPTSSATAQDRCYENNHRQPVKRRAVQIAASATFRASSIAAWIARDVPARGICRIVFFQVDKAFAGVAAACRLLGINVLVKNRWRTSEPPAKIITTSCYCQIMIN